MLTECRQWLQDHMAPPGVTVYRVTSRQWLYADYNHLNVNVVGGTDFVFMADCVWWGPVDREPSVPELMGSLQGVLGAYELRSQAYVQGGPTMIPGLCHAALRLHPSTHGCVIWFPTGLRLVARVYPHSTVIRNVQMPSHVVCLYVGVHLNCGTLPCPPCSCR
jgi:hypothetical protein